MNEFFVCVNKRTPYVEPNIPKVRHWWYELAVWEADSKNPLAVSKYFYTPVATMSSDRFMRSGYCVKVRAEMSKEASQGVTTLLSPEFIEGSQVFYSTQRCKLSEFEKTVLEYRAAA